VYRGVSVGVYLPCRNEADHLARVVTSLPPLVDEIIVVSNRSTDGTPDVARRLGVTTVTDDRHIRGIGYGFAHMTGMRSCQSDLIVTADGDGSYPLEDVERVVDHLLHHELDFVSCNRYPLQHGSHIPRRLRLGVALLNAEVRSLYGLRVDDILSGMWAFRRELQPHLHLTSGNWNLSPEIKLWAALSPGIRFGELPVVQHRRQGESHQNYLRTGVSHAGWILRNRLRPARSARAPGPELLTQPAAHSAHG
jgi:glycosyltransferase involved in cell wall biosynthesis